MQTENIGHIIRKYRMEKGFTQKELAELLSVTDKAISKWERGIGLPDIATIESLADALSINSELLLTGVEKYDESKRHKMKKASFYSCEKCGNFTYSIDDLDVYCCDKKLKRLIPQEMDDHHTLEIVEFDGQNQLRINHEMSKNHFIKFVGIRNGTEIRLIETFPEWDFSITCGNLNFARIYFYCTNHGLFYRQLRKIK